MARSCTAKTCWVDGKKFISLGHIKPYMVCSSWWGNSESEAIDEKLAQKDSTYFCSTAVQHYCGKAMKMRSYQNRNAQQHMQKSNGKGQELFFRSVSFCRFSMHSQANFKFMSPPTPETREAVTIVTKYQWISRLSKYIFITVPLILYKPSYSLLNAMAASSVQQTFIVQEISRSEHKLKYGYSANQAIAVFKISRQSR